MIYFDNAATSGMKPQGVIKAVESALKNYSANPGRSGHFTAQKTAEKVYETREKVADFFGAKATDNVIFTMNCTHSINIVIKGILHRGDHIIISNLEHNAVLRPLKKWGVSYDVVKVDFVDDGKTAEEFKSKIKTNTKMVLCTAASNVFGKMLPLKEIGKICKNRGILFAVDAAQGAGVMPINMKEMNIDFLCIAPHKGLYSPTGIGILITDKFIPNTLIEGGTGTNSLELTQPMILPERLESGTLNIPAIFGVSAGIDFVKKTGLEKIYNHEMMLTESLYKSLKNTDGITLYTPPPKRGEYAPVLSFNYGDLHSEKVGNILSEKGFAVRAGLHCAPLAHKAFGTQDRGAVRVSVSAFNTLQEVQEFQKVLKTIKNFKNL